MHSWLQVEPSWTLREKREREKKRETERIREDSDRNGGGDDTPLPVGPGLPWWT